jgi:adenylate kinase
MNVIFLGPPGSGKGTQAEKISHALKIPHLSTGDLLREAVRNETELGAKARKYMDAGNLVPDDIIIGLIEEKIRDGLLDNGSILDGFPRTIPQAEALKKMLERYRKAIDKVILLAVSDQEVIKRLSGRFYCPTCNAGYNYPARLPLKEGVCDKDGSTLLRRRDDEEDVVKNRLEVYEKQTAPIVDFYRREGNLFEVAAEDGPDKIFERILKLLNEDK